MNMKKISQYLINKREDVSFISPQILDPIPYKNKDRNTWVKITNPEFTSICPKTGLPDFATITINYLPDKKIVELKSLKYYYIQFRNTGIYYENLTQLILNHLSNVLKPLKMTIEAEFTSRGGISSVITSTYKK